MRKVFALQLWHRPMRWMPDGLISVFRIALRAISLPKFMLLKNIIFKPAALKSAVAIRPASKYPSQLLGRTAFAYLWLALPCAAAVPEYQLVIQDHLFSPSQLQIPANQKVKIVIYNHDDSPEEFESFSLNREKVILPRSKGVVFIGPLPPGEHAFFGEYNPDTAKGVIVIRPEAGDAD